MSASGTADADLIAELLGRHYREPSRQRAQALFAAQPPGRQDVVLRFALGLPVELADPALRGREAAARLARDAVFYIRRCFSGDGATHYQVLGLTPDASPDAVRENFRLLMQLIHPDRQGTQPRWPESFAARVNRAYAVLKVPQTRAAYDRELAARAGDVVARAAAAARSGSGAPPRRAARRGPRPPAPPLPEWLTVGVGGCVREHPAMSSLLAIVVGAASIIGTVAWESRDATLTREARSEIIAKRPVTVAARAAEPEFPGLAPAAAPVAAASPPAAPATATERIPAPATDASPRDAAPVRESGVPATARTVSATAPAARADAGAATAPQPPASPAAYLPTATVLASAPLAPGDPAAASTTAVALGGGGAVPVGATMAAALPSALPAAAEPTSVTPPPANGEIEAFFAAFVDAYERGRPDAFAALFDDNAETNLRRGRPAIRGDYDELFRQSSWRRMQLTRISWRRVGDRALAKGEISVRIGWRDGREVEQHVAVDMELVRRDGRALIAKLSQQPRN